MTHQAGLHKGNLLDKVEILALAIAAFLSILIAALDFSGALHSIPKLADWVQSLTLLAVGTVAGYLALERRNYLNRMHLDSMLRIDMLSETMKNGFSDTVSELQGVKVVPYRTPEDAYIHLAELVEKAKHHIELASFGTSPSRKNEGAKRWIGAVREAAKKDVHFRYICTFQDQARFEHVQLLKEPEAECFFVRYFPSDLQVPPMLNFLAVDSQEIVAMFPSVDNQPPVWLSVRNREIIDLFEQYFGVLWRGSKEITKDNLDNGTLDKIARQEGGG